MAIEPFAPKDFKVFDIPNFAGRMAAIRTQIRPKLESLGTALAPPLARVAKVGLFPHVAKHARRTVNPPDDTWVAFGPHPRGYKKARHFKVAVSRRTIRFLFEIGPEYASKPAFAKAWKREAPRLARGFRRAPGLAWFKNEHDEDPSALLADLGPSSLARLGDELTRTRDSHLVLGRRVDAAKAATWQGPHYLEAALETFTALAECFRLR